MKGIPIRIEIGPKDLEKKQDVVVRRDSGHKETIDDKDLAKKIPILLEDIQKNLYLRARAFLDSRIDTARDLAQLAKKLDEGKIVKVFLVDDKEVEAKLKEKTGANSRIVEEQAHEGVCVVSGESTKTIAYVAKSY